MSLDSCTWNLQPSLMPTSVLIYNLQSSLLILRSLDQADQAGFEFGCNMFHLSYFLSSQVVGVKITCVYILIGFYFICFIFIDMRRLMYNIKQKIEGIHEYDKTAWVIELDRERNADTLYKSHMDRYTSKKSFVFSGNWPDLPRYGSSTWQTTRSLFTQGKSPKVLQHIYCYIQNINRHTYY